jgi:uncharacterized protein YecT (DUF1311 family)
MILLISLLGTYASVSLAQNLHARQQHVEAAMVALKAEQAKEGKDCANAKSQYEDNVCTAETAKAADSNLSAFYDNLKSILGSENRTDLQESQNAWLQYRTKTCDAVFDFYKDGTIRNAEQARCQTRLTRQRIRDLDYLYEGPLHH